MAYDYDAVIKSGICPQHGKTRAGDCWICLKLGSSTASAVVV